ncbi:ATP-binding protein [Maridesulfovibrio sp.]|uniref:ATP-binding protein n=1 Tax=Maridesulfovibrio sp. TaxID=2795000 RepID=UPI0029F49626|nr:ATP-binding protein [Maridesulfovibrio sp.]
MEESPNKSKSELEKVRRQAINAEMNIKALLDANTQSILLLKPDGKVIHVNRTVAETMGTTPEDLIGKDIFSYLSDELAEFRREQLKKVVETGAHLKFQDIRDGRTILQSYYPIFEGDKVRRIAIYAEDITDMVSNELELKRSRHQLSVFLQIMDQSNFSKTMEELLVSIHALMCRELKADSFNIALIDQHREKLDFTCHEDEYSTTCQCISDIYHPENKNINLLPIRKNGTIRLTRQKIEQGLRNKSIELFGPIPEIWVGVPMLRRNTPIGVLVIQDYHNANAFSDHDIELFTACSDHIAHTIERKQFETATRESEELYRAFFEDNHSVMFIIDPSDGRIEDATNAAANFYGFNRNELKSKTVFDLNQLPKSKVIAQMQEAKRNDLASFIFQHRIANGEVRDVEVFSGPFNFKGKVWLISIVHDITQRLKYEKELSKAKEAAILANKTKDEFLANISHEIRTPLNGVMGMLQVMNTDDLKEEHRECIKVALQSSRNLLRVLDDILDISKVAAGTLDLIEENFSLKQVLNDSVELFKHQADCKNIKLSFYVADKIQDTYIGDEGRIRQILFNLVGNSVKFTDEGSITIRIRSGAESNEDKTQLLFTVTDTGMGIPEKYQRSIFDSFTQVDGSLSRKYKGAGLGLSIVKRLVDLMGGSVNIESSLGEGTSVTFSLFLKHAEKNATDAEEQPNTKHLPGRLAIMLVEDEPVNRMMASKLLKRMGHDVICAENGTECLEKLQYAKIDAILMDIQMPGMDGLEATRRIRTSEDFTRKRNVPIIALSAHASKESRYAALEAGVNAYLCKPFEINDLKKILASSIHQN